MKLQSWQADQDGTEESKAKASRFVLELGSLGYAISERLPLVRGAKRKMALDGGFVRDSSSNKDDGCGHGSVVDGKVIVRDIRDLFLVTVGSSRYGKRYH